MESEFLPTPTQVGAIVSSSVYEGPVRKLSASTDAGDLSDAEISQIEFEQELLLLCYAAAVHTIETAGLAPGVDTEVVAGLYARIRELPNATARFMLENVEEAVEAFAAAAQADAQSPPIGSKVSEIEQEFGQRLFERGDDNAVRGRACARLSLTIPAILWRVSCKSTAQTLKDARLIQIQ